MPLTQLHAFPIISANKLNHLFTNAVVVGVLGGGRPMLSTTGQMLKYAVLYWSRMVMQQKVKGSLALQFFFHNL